MNFGTIKDIFTNKLIESYVSGDSNLNEHGKKLYKSFLKELKENETLRTAFIVYKNIEEKTIKNESLANDYLKENISFLNKFRGDKSLVSQTKKLVKILEDKGFNFENFRKFNKNKKIGCKYRQNTRIKK